MAINSLTTSSDKIPLLSLCSLNSSKGSFIPSRLVKLNFATDSSVTSSIKSNKIRKNRHSKSPYLNNSDKVHLLSRVTEKRLVQKNTADFVSSFPLAVNLYKANSDEFKAVKGNNKRAKKSVLTLPNKYAPVPQKCTVSNDSEDFNHDDDNRKRRPKKRPTLQNRKSHNDFEFYDRDARYCSQFNIHLDCSSTDVIRNTNGDGKKTLNTKKQYKTPKKKVEGKINGHDVWRVLRNLNRFQFRPSPPMSEENIPLPRKEDNKMWFNRKDTRLIETCRTEEFAYISSIEVDRTSPTTFSHSSSFDRVTVIDKKDELSRICEEFEERLAKTQNNANNSKNSKLTRIKNKSLVKKSFRSCKKVPGTKETNQNTISTNKAIDLNSHTHSYENNTFDLVNNYNSSNINKDSLTFNAHTDIQQKKNNGIPTNSILKNDQMKNAIDRSTTENNNFLSSVNSVSSKTCLQETTKGPDKLIKISQDKSNQPFNGITKVILSKGQDIFLPKPLETPKRKSRLATTLTSTTTIPKLTQTDIRRRLLNIKFPLVILGKDEVSSTIEAIDYDPLQFEGLDKHIWPFMIEWSDDGKFESKGGSISKSNQMINSIDDSIVQKNKFDHFHGDNKFNKAPNRKVDISVYKQPINKDKKWAAELKLVSNKRDHSVILQKDLNNKTREPIKQKPIHQFKDKMLKFLYKKSSVIDGSEVNLRAAGQCNAKYNENSVVMNTILNKTDVCVNANIKANAVVNDFATKHPLNSRLTDNTTDDTSVTIKRPWAKAKWASDFIENVIRKIKNGVYYNQDSKYDSENLCSVVKEASVQTRFVSENINKIIVHDTEIDHSSEQSSLNKSNELLKTIPGFDSSLPELEVQTLNTNRIEIKNCVTNIIVQFDITVPRESEELGIHLKKSCSLIPIDKNDSNIKLFKCKATILNAMLPAELCSILPNMMRKIVQPDTKSSHPLPINKTDSQLSTISEISHFECFDSLGIPKLGILLPEVRHILSGKFSHSNTNQQRFIKVKSIFNLSEISLNLLPKMPEKLAIPCIKNPMEIFLKTIKSMDMPLMQHINHNECKLNNNKTLLPYNLKKHSLIPRGRIFNLLDIFENMWPSYKMFGRINFSPSNHISTICVDIRTNENIAEKNVIINIGNLYIDSLFDNHAKIINEHNSEMALQRIDYLDGTFSDLDVSRKPKPEKRVIQLHGNHNKIKRKGFVKLYKKCKSTTNIPNEKSSLPLSKIINLDDFFQLLGSKSLSCAFDGNSGKKILTSIVTMKNWITQINSRQALLVLLLANKKDTPNLIRFRPVLLQGIAVNRITRASELDMELEVIERENLNGFSQFEGISYLPASIENKDNLLEELYWIAKTTASDYQKPFDESSEKLLKSLLEKRKKLNPSYLRVMARYVGLGLLKSPSKK